MRLALFQPDIPQNTGSLIRLCACLGVPLDIIEPCGFALDDKALRRVGMDYVAGAQLTRHADYGAFTAKAGRTILLTTKADRAYTAFAFAPGDTLLLGRESVGVPAFVHDAAHARLRVPMMPGARALNIALAAAMVLGEALRQMEGFPSSQEADDAEGRDA